MKTQSYEVWTINADKTESKTTVLATSAQQAYDRVVNGETPTAVVRDLRTNEEYWFFDA